MLDGLEAFTHRQFQVLSGDVVLPVDEGLGPIAAIMRQGPDHALGIALDRLDGKGLGHRMTGRIGPRCKAVGQGLRQPELAPASACRAFSLCRLTRQIGFQGLVPHHLAPRLREQVNAGRKAAGHQNGIAGQGFSVTNLTGRNDRSDIGTLDPKLSDCAGDGVAFLDLQASSLGRLDQRAARIGPCIDNGSDLDARPVHVQSGAIGLIMAGGHDHPLTGLDPIAVQIDAGRVGQQNTGAIIVWEDQWTLDRSGGQHDLASTNLPQTLTRGTGRWMGLMLAEALSDTDHIVREIAKGVGAADHRHFGIGGQGRQRLSKPRLCRLAIDQRVGRGQKRAAELRLLVDQHHTATAFRSRQGCGQTGRASTNDQHFAVGETVQIAVGVRLGRGAAETSGSADGGLIEMVPRFARPHEGLVVEARRNEGRQQARHRAHVKIQARPAVLALGDKAVIELDLGGAQIWCEAGLVPAHRDQRIGLFGACAQHAARTVIFERAAHQVNAIGQEGRGQRIALYALIAAAIKAEGQALAAVDLAASVCAERRAHAAGPFRSGRASPVL